MLQRPVLPIKPSPSSGVHTIFAPNGYEPTHQPIRAHMTHHPNAAPAVSGVNWGTQLSQCSSNPITKPQETPKRPPPHPGKPAHLFRGQARWPELISHPDRERPSLINPIARRVRPPQIDEPWALPHARTRLDRRLINLPSDSFTSGDRSPTTWLGYTCKTVVHCPNA